jgi:beta-lactamase regulating signal transducer with metallopeptidase domain
MLVLIRLVLPFSFPLSGIELNINPASISSGVIQQYVNPQTIRPTSVGANSAAKGNTSENDTPLSSSTQRSGGGVNPFYFLLNHLFEIWLFGMLLCLLVQTVGYIRLAKQLKTSNFPLSKAEVAILGRISKRNFPVYYNRFVATPMLLGLFRPRIILPNIVFTDEQISFIFQHELTHLRHKDIAVKWLTVVVTSIHWFNPLMYYLKREINRSCELACDETLIKSLDLSEKQSYGETLIMVVAEHRKPAGSLFTTMCEEKKALKERLASIMKFKKTRHITAVSTFALILTLLCTFVSCAKIVKTDKTNDSKISGTVSAVVSQLDFSSMTFNGPDTNVQNNNVTYKATDQTIMNKVWNALKTGKWTETDSFHSNANSIITLHFEGEQSGWYVITPDNFAYYSLGDGPDLLQQSPLGFAHTGDKSYSIPSDVYNSVAKLLQDYTSQNPPAYQLDAVLKDALTAQDTLIQYKAKDIHVSDYSTDQILDVYMSAFGNLNEWEPVNTGDVGNFTDSNHVSINHNYETSNTTIDLFMDRDFVDVSVMGISHWYRVPSGVMTNILNTVQKEK